MYQYIFVETSLGGFFSSATHRETISEYAADGWRLLQVLPLEYNGHGKTTSYEIIFERLVQN
ncbi:DUF4177 domain-containing protein [Bacillus sp. ISL-55]|uniref:DUF4177 domain-containing protein n=1 Tax=Bacillus sp. ISL-55 TaxID=2819134 RepID=UPI001BEB9CE3|nr:DUF4177 domain-containing protein [Bacillus sp. ISL-55]MBT2695131.1 DUF4177 domain-containing protein [Bacillus sp. ISL-55]